MHREVVHHHNVACAEARREHFTQVRAEDFRIRAARDAHRRDHPGRRECADEAHVVRPVDRGCAVRTLPARRSGVAARQRDVDA